MLVMKLTAVLNDRCGTTAGTSVGLSGSEPWNRWMRVDEEERDDAEAEQRVRVHRPALLAVRVDAADAVDRALDRAEEAVARRRLVVAVDLGHVAAERDRGADQRPRSAPTNCSQLAEDI